MKISNIIVIIPNINIYNATKLNKIVYLMLCFFFENDTTGF